MPRTIRFSPALCLCLALFACDEKSDASPSAATAPAGPTYTPELTKDLVPPAFAGLVPGIATQADATAAFGEGEVDEDKSLGGTAKVQYSDAAAVRVTWGAKGDRAEAEAWFVGDQLQRLQVATTTTGACRWIAEHVGKLDGATRRPGSNRKYEGDRGDRVEYSAGTPDGSAPVGIECNKSTRDGTTLEYVSYGIENARGTSMVVQKDD